MMTFPKPIFLAGAVAATACCSIHAEFPALRLEPIAIGQFSSPVAITHAGDGSGRLFIADQRGRIYILHDGAVLPEPFLDIENKLVTERPGFDERGLLGLAFHPEYATKSAPGEGHFYIYYSAPSPDAPGTASDPVDHRSVIAEFRVSAENPNQADPSSERVLLTFNQPQFNHNGGQLAFGPDDGLLYISTGDGGSANDNNAGHTGGDSSQPSGVLGNAQDLTRLLGKVLRIQPLGTNGPGGQYGIPPGNPFVNSPGGEREEIFAYGLRNPWRFSFDKPPGEPQRLFLADVGQGRFEEINLIIPGGNYGWRAFEGFSDFDPTAPSSGPYEEPIASYSRNGQSGDSGLPEIGISVTGGYVYRGTAIPELQGKYIFGDWSTSFGAPNGTLLGLEESAPGVFDLSILEIEGGNPIGRFIPCFGVDEQGEIYVGTKMSLGPSAPHPDTGEPAGQLFKIVAQAEPVEITLVPSRDNSIYSDFPNNSNGAGDLFAGRIQSGDGVRRALLQFDLDEVPAGSQIIDATLSLTVNMTTTGSFDFSLHRLLRDWGEAGSFGTGTGGPAQTGDATWSNAFHPGDAWSAAGGDFVSSASATTAVGALGQYQWTSPQLADDVQQWLDNPDQNHGWILLGNEATPSAKRIHSSESGNSGARPALTIHYLATSALSRRQIWEREHFQIGQYIDPEDDADGDGIPALLEYAWDRNPAISDADPNDLALALGPPTATIRFRRDPRAADLNYILEVSSDLQNWSAIVTSSSGEPPSNPAFLSESPDPANPELRIVEAALPFDQDRQFTRLRVERP